MPALRGRAGRGPAGDWAEFSGLQRLVSTTILIPLALNLFWYSLMVKGLRAVLRGGAKANAQP